MATGVLPLSGKVVQSDDNLVNGQVYTFVFQYTDVYANPNANALLAPLDATAPDFIANDTATQEGTSEYYNLVWTYEGDGTDIVSDVANAMIAAWFGPLGTFEFTIGFGGALPTYNISSGASGAAGVTYSFSLGNLIEPVTPEQQASYQSEASAQVSGVAASSGGQIATLQPAFVATTAAQATSASNNVAAISSQANTAAALSNTTVLLVIAGVVVGLFFFLRPRMA